MPRAEAGTTKALANQMKSKGLQRLRWYCQPCEKQCRDENGFKCHTQSESHVRQMQVIGANPSKAIDTYSSQFVADFIRQLRTQHNTKAVHMNQFYQTYIANKEHIHMNATKWKSLTEFAKHLGREGICRVEETDKGLHIAWIDNSPEALARQEAIRKRERMDKGDEEIELKLIQDQVERAHRRAREREEEAARKAGETDAPAEDSAPASDGKVAFSLVPKKPPTPPTSDGGAATTDTTTNAAAGTKRKADELTPPSDDPPRKPFGFSMPAAKPKNALAAAHRNPFKKDKGVVREAPKKMSETERIMREEIEARKRREERMGFRKTRA